MEALLVVLSKRIIGVVTTGTKALGPATGVTNEPRTPTACTLHSSMIATDVPSVSVPTLAVGVVSPSVVKRKDVKAAAGEVMVKVLLLVLTSPMTGVRVEALEASVSRNTELSSIEAYPPIMPE